MNATTTVAAILLNSSMTMSTLSSIAPAVVSTTTATSTFVTPLFSQRNIHHGYGKGYSTKPHIKDFSPVTLSTEWPSMAKLLVLACLSVIGSIGNVFMISSVMIEDHLKKAGNAFIVSVALADLLVSSILIPTSVIVLLAGIDESSTTAICRVQWFFAACAFLVTILSLALTSFENYLRLCTPQDSPSWFNRSNTTTILLMLWCISGAASGVQFASNVAFDFCQRKWLGMVPYQMVIVAILIVLPLVVTFYTHMRIILDVKRFMSTPNFKPSLNYTWDLALARTNFYSFLIFIAFWLPFGIVLSYHVTADVTKRSFYATAWIGFIKSCFHNVIYCITNRHFRNAYVNLFHYCCCKTTVSVSRRQRTETCRPTSDVRVHIIPGYNMYSYTSPQRSGNCHNYWSKRDVHEL